MKMEDQIELTEKTGLKIEKKVYIFFMGLVMAMNCMLFQNNYVKIWNEIRKDMLRWGKLQLSLLGRISVMK